MATWLDHFLCGLARFIRMAALLAKISVYCLMTFLIGLVIYEKFRVPSWTDLAIGVLGIVCVIGGAALLVWAYTWAENYDCNRRIAIRHNAAGGEPK